MKLKFNRKMRRHFKRFKSVYAMIALIGGLIVFAIWGAEVMMEKESDYVEVVSAMTGTEEERYQEALKLIESGDKQRGRIAMQRLARLGESADEPLGYGKAHLWMAEDILSHFQHDFIWDFPMQVTKKGGEFQIGDEKEMRLAQRHLEHAISLTPELAKAPELLAALLATQGRKSEAVGVLISAITHAKAPQPKLVIPLSNIAVFPASKEEELRLKEYLLHTFAILGDQLSFAREGDLSLRAKYALSALLLNKFENTEVVIQGLEARYDFPSKGLEEDSGRCNRVSNYQQVRSLRLAFHYSRAVQRMLGVDSDSLSKYESVVEDLAQALKVKPDCLPVVHALSKIAAREPKLKTKIKSILESALSNKETASAEVRSQMNLALFLVGEDQREGDVHYLKKAIAENPSNGIALLEMAQWIRSKKPVDFHEIGELSARALNLLPQERKAECYLILGVSKIHRKEWVEAIVFLERALSEQKRTGEVHRLLAAAYQGAGRKSLAQKHLKLLENL